MAYSLILKNGTETGATLTDKLNIIIADLNEVDLSNLPLTLSNINLNIDNIELDIVDLQNEDISLQTQIDARIPYTDRGILSLTTSVESTQSLTSSFVKIGWVDSVYLNNSNSHMSYDNLNKRLTFNTTGVYQLFASGNIEADVNAELQFKYYLNGTDITPGTSAVYITRGSGKPIAVNDSRFISVTAGDYIEVYAAANSATNLVIKASTLDVIKTCVPI